MPTSRDKAGNKSKKNSTSFKPGQSGNPSGAGRMPVEFKDLAKGYSRDALKVVIDIMQDNKASQKDRLRASDMIMDRAWGKAMQGMEVSGPEGKPIETHSLTALTDSELITLEQILSNHTNP